MSGAELAEKLKGVDAVYSAGFQAQGHEVVSPPYNVPRNPKVPMKWRFSVAGPRSALIQEAKDIPFRYIKPKDESNGDPKAPQKTGLGKQYRHSDLDYDQEGNLMVSVFTKTISSFDQARGAEHYISTLFGVSPEDKIKWQTESHTISFSPPDTAVLSMPIQQGWWTLGRGFSPYIDQITSVTKLDNGLLAASCRGTYDRKDIRGRWELKIDPAAAYLVTEADLYSPEEAKEPWISVRTRGLKVNGPCFFPGEATWKLIASSSLPPAVHELTFEDAKLEPDEALLTEAADALREPYPPKSILKDYRTTPYTYVVVAEPPGQAESDPVSETVRTSLFFSRGTAFWVLVINGILLALLLSFFFYQKLREGR